MPVPEFDRAPDETILDKDGSRIECEICEDRGATRAVEGFNAGFVWHLCDACARAYDTGVKYGRSQLEPVLEEFVDDINAIGGVYRETSGLWNIVSGEEWIDLAETYVNACEALGRTPKIEERDDDEDDEGDLDD